MLNLCQHVTVDDARAKDPLMKSKWERDSADDASIAAASTATATLTQGALSKWERLEVEESSGILSALSNNQISQISQSSSSAWYASFSFSTTCYSYIYINQTIINNKPT